MGDKDPWDRHKTLATLQPSFVMPELDITHSSWLGKSFPLIDILRHNPTSWPQSVSKNSFQILFLQICIFKLYKKAKEPLTCHSFRRMWVFTCQRVKKDPMKFTDGSFKITFPYSNISLRFWKSKHTSSDWVVTVTACPHPHLHCIFLNFASAVRNNQTTDETNEIPLQASV